MKDLDVIKVNLTKDNIEKIYELDKCFYNLDINWYFDRYNEDNVAYVLVKDDIYVGYIVSLPIKKYLYEALCNGVIIDDININPSMYVNISDFYYIVSCVVLPEYRNMGYGSRLMEVVMNDISGKCVSLAMSKEGYNLLNKYLPNKKNIYKNIFVFNN